MAVNLVRIKVIEGDEDTGIVDIAEFVVDARSKEDHGRGEVHIAKRHRT